jgi:hypothetical protein
VNAKQKTERQMSESMTRRSRCGQKDLLESSKPVCRVGGGSPQLMKVQPSRIPTGSQPIKPANQVSGGWCVLSCL